MAMQVYEDLKALSKNVSSEVLVESVELDEAKYIFVRTLSYLSVYRVVAQYRNKTNSMCSLFLFLPVKQDKLYVRYVLTLLY